MIKLAVLFLVLVLSCKPNTGKDKTSVKSKIGSNDNDCIFNQETQTDDFLKGIKIFKNYKWDNKAKTAKIKLENGDSIIIFRGGCVHFGVSAKMKIKKSTIDFSDWENVNTKVLWIAKILQNEFNYKMLKAELDSSNYEIEKGQRADILTFKDDYLIQNNYLVYRILGKKYDVIELSYYIN